MWCHGHQIMPLALVIVSCEAMALVSASCDVDSTINGAIAFLRSIWSEWSTHEFLGHVSPLGPILASCDAPCVVNGTTAFLRSRNENEVQHYLLVIWSHWQWHQCHIMMCNITFLIMWFHWCWHQCHVMPMVSSMAPLHSLHQGNLNEVQHQFLAIDTIGTSGRVKWYSVVNGTTTFLRTKWLKWGATWCFWPCYTIGWHPHISTLLGSRWSKWDATWLFLVMWPNNALYILIPHYCTYKTKQQQHHQTSAFIFHAIHIPTTNMTLKYLRCATYAHDFMCTYETTILVNVLQMNSMQSTMSLQALVYIHFT